MTAEELKQKTTDRKVMFAENKLRKNLVNDICKQIDDIEWDSSLDEDPKAAIELAALKNLKRIQLSAWRQFRTKNGLSNDALVGA